jgi:hypothetical protein
MWSKEEIFACPSIFDCPARINTFRGCFAGSANAVDVRAANMTAINEARLGDWRGKDFMDLPV